MSIMLRRERRRRNLTPLQSHARPLPHFALVERHDLLSHHGRANENRILVTCDYFLALGIHHSPPPLCYCTIYNNLDEALNVVRGTQPLNLIIDIEGWPVPTLDILNHLLDLHKRHPGLEISLITPEKAFSYRRFLQAACLCRLIDKHLELKQLRDALQYRRLPLPASHRLFKTREWSVLMLMARGLSLCEIARHQQRPYHRITYRVNCIIALLRLEKRQQLLSLLQKISATPPGHTSE